MGEYINWNDQYTKLGTCEELYYVRYDDILAMIADGATTESENYQVADYLTNGYRYRFPFPDEDAGGVGNRETDHNYDRGLPVVLPAGPESAELLNFDHDDHPYYKETSPYPWAGVCPMSPANPNRPDAYHLEIAQQKAVDGCLWTVIRCPFCGNKARIDAEDGRFLAAYLEAQANRYNLPAWRIMAERIREGYERKLAPPPAVKPALAVVQKPAPAPVTPAPAREQYEHLTRTETAKLVRAALKAAFPGVKFSVRSEHRSSIRVDWTDGPTEAQVKPAIDKYEGADFDSSQDLAIYRDGFTLPDGRHVKSGARWIFTNRRFTAEFTRKVGAAINKLTGWPMPAIYPDGQFVVDFQQVAPGSTTPLADHFNKTLRATGTDGKVSKIVYW